MSKGWKIALTVGGAVALLLLLGVWGAMRWFEKNEESLKEGAKQAASEGENFGTQKSAADCEAEGLRRLDDCAGFICSAMNSVFMGSCLEATVYDASFCADIPAESEVLDSASYRVRRCQESGREGNFCNEVFGSVQRYCDEHR